MVSVFDCAILLSAKRYFRVGNRCGVYRKICWDMSSLFTWYFLTKRAAKYRNIRRRSIERA